MICPICNNETHENVCPSCGYMLENDLLYNRLMTKLNVKEIDDYNRHISMYKMLYQSYDSGNNQ